MHAELYDRSRPVTQLHWGGGTPTFLSEAQMQMLMAVTRRHFAVAADDRAEVGIELDPREVREPTLRVLREIGFNRASLGIQDFEPAVQKAVNRIQSEALTGARHRRSATRRIPLRVGRSDLRSAVSDAARR